MTDALRRLLATGCAVLVLLLGLMTVNPGLHDLAHQSASTDKSACAHQDHGHATPPADQANNGHECAVTLFAQGLALATPVVAPDTTPVTWHELNFPAVEEPLLTAPRYLHHPEHGPPVA
jgi:hypothetical protein